MDADPRFQPGRIMYFNERQQTRREPTPPTPEEIQDFNSCIRSGVFKAGLPFAVVMDYLSRFLKKKDLKLIRPSAAPPTKRQFPAKRTLTFLFNICFGTFIYSPVCFSRLKEKYDARQQNLLKKNEEDGIFTTACGNTLQTDDFSSYSSSDPNLDGPKSAFSHLDLDFDSTVSENLILENVEDQKPKQSIPETTYDDLRRRNRENYNRIVISTAPPVRNDVPPTSYAGPVPQKQTSNEPSFRKVIKNKYGDDMEI